MQKLFWQAIKVAPAIIGASLIIAGSPAVAQTEVEPAQAETTQEGELLDQINNYSEEADTQSQVTNVTQLRDVAPTDWAFEALRSLVERYGCIEGYPDQTYRGNRALTRYEFAAGLNSCLNSIERLIAAGGGVSAEDLERLQRLAQEFEAELATLGARVDNLEGRVAFLEDNQFSTTTKLEGEAIFALSDIFPIEGTDQAFDVQLNELGQAALVPNTAEDLDIDSVTTLSDRVRLNLNASFTGEDRLRVRLEGGNTPDYGDIANTDSVRLGFQENNDNNVDLTQLYYTAPVGDNFRVFLGANDIALDDIVQTVANPYFASSGNGALSRFGRYNPIVYRLSTDQGVGVNVGFAEAVSVDLAYLVDGGENPETGDGLFNGDFAAAAQLNFTPSDRFQAALTYVYSYQPGGTLVVDDAGSTISEGGDVSLAGGTSSLIADQPFGQTGTRAHRLGAQASFQLGEAINLSGWFGYAFASVESSDGVETTFENIDYDNADILTAAVSLAFLDFGREGSVLGLIAGIPPYNTSIDDVDVPINTGSVVNADFDSFDDYDSVPLFFEANYRFPINDNIQITPGAYVVVNPNQNSDNQPILVGVIRGTFSF